jgi:hypothetical protein
MDRTFLKQVLQELFLKTAETVDPRDDSDHKGAMLSKLSVNQFSFMLVFSSNDGIGRSERRYSTQRETEWLMIKGDTVLLTYNLKNNAGNW